MVAKLVLLLFFVIVSCCRGTIIWPAIEKLTAGKMKGSAGYQPYEPTRDSWEGITFLSFVVMIFFVLFAEGPIYLWETKIGLAIYCFGLLLASLGRFSLGVSWADIHMVTNEKQKLVITGIYRLTRNPIYAGILIMNLGIGVSLGVLMDDWAFIPGIICLMGRFLDHRRAMINEEDFLKGRYGEEYGKYCKRVGRYFLKIKMPTFKVRIRLEE